MSELIINNLLATIYQSINQLLLGAIAYLRQSDLLVLILLGSKVQISGLLLSCCY